MGELAINVGSSESIIDVLKNQGLNFSTRMEIAIPSVPTDITELDDEGLMNLFAELTAYANFLSAQYSCALIDEKNS
jgi:aconitase B